MARNEHYVENSIRLLSTEFFHFKSFWSMEKPLMLDYLSFYHEIKFHADFASSI